MCASMVSMLIFVLVKLKFKIDFSGLITIVCKLIVSIQRLVTFYIFTNNEEDRIYNNCWQIFGNSLIWFSLYYFTFELFIIKSTLEASSAQELKQIKYKITIYKAISSIVLLLNSVIMVVLFLRNIPNIINIGQDYARILDALNTIIKALFDFALFCLFTHLLRYFLKIRTQRSSALSIFNKFMIGCTIFFFVLCIYQSLTFVHTYIASIVYGDFIH